MRSFCTCDQTTPTTKGIIITERNLTATVSGTNPGTEGIVQIKGEIRLQTTSARYVRPYFMSAAALDARGLRESCIVMSWHM